MGRGATLLELGIGSSLGGLVFVGSDGGLVELFRICVERDLGCCLPKRNDFVMSWPRLDEAVAGADEGPGRKNMRARAFILLSRCGRMRLEITM